MRRAEGTEAREEGRLEVREWAMEDLDHRDIIPLAPLSPRQSFLTLNMPDRPSPIGPIRPTARMRTIAEAMSSVGSVTTAERRLEEMPTTNGVKVVPPSRER